MIPFFGTPCLPAVAVLKHVAQAFDRAVERFDLRMFASYASQRRAGLSGAGPVARAGRRA